MELVAMTLERHPLNPKPLVFLLMHNRQCAHRYGNGEEVIIWKPESGRI
jgi:hypothetical protein